MVEFSKKERVCTKIVGQTKNKPMQGKRQFFEPPLIITPCNCGQKGDVYDFMLLSARG
jgi:hypothetical protein